ncbi:MAG TPA: xylose isomerase [Prolixibacteraceae bacterium]|jgi:sugar phosphate isomerase/epimerase|nr:xylose isomerase [Prolixibacteraceae bacterium]
MQANRRNFLKLSGLGMAAVAMPGIAQSASSTAKKDQSLPIRLGLASYTLRKMNLDDALAVCQRMDLKHISLKDFHLKLNATDAEIAEVVKKCKDAGVELGSGGVIYMKTEADVNAAFEYARKAGMNMIIGVPNHDMLPYAEKKVKEYNIRLAVHNHGPGDLVYPSCESAYVLIKDMDPRMGLCLDIGHTQRIGRNPSADLKDYFARIFEIHMKDVTTSDSNGKAIEVGRGVIDIPGFLKTIIHKKFTGIVSFEYEKDDKDPVPGLAESMGYVKGVLKVID